MNDAVSTAMITRNLIGTPTSVFNYTGDEMAPASLKLQNVTFGLFGSLYLPKKVETGVGTSLPLAMVTDIDFLTYDSRGNLQTYKERNGSTSKLEYYGAADVGKTDLLKKSTAFEGTTLPYSSAFTYLPAVGMESNSDANSKTIFYEYDEFGRLKSIRNTSLAGPVRDSYCYNYAGQIVDCAALAPTGSIAATALALLADVALPVTLLEFEAVKQEKKAMLTWSTTSETNSDHFDIERSPNGQHWTKIGSEKALGESDTLKSYSLADAKPLSGENLYRLKMVDMDSSFAYSRIRNVVFEESGKATLYPNPVTVGKEVQLLTDDLSKITSIRIFDTAGQMVMQPAVGRAIKIDTLSAGIYILQFTYSDGSMSTQRIVKQ